MARKRGPRLESAFDDADRKEFVAMVDKYGENGTLTEKSLHEMLISELRRCRELLTKIQTGGTDENAGTTA